MAVEPVSVGEGVEVTGLVLFPHDSLRRLEIVWHDSVGRRAPARLILHGSRSRWRVSPGVSLGTSLATLERLNGRPFLLAGFGWDYSGVVYDWRGGRLESLKGRVYVYLEAGARVNDGAAARLEGEREFGSDNPDMRSVRPTVGTIFIDW